MLLHIVVGGGGGGGGGDGGHHNLLVGNYKILERSGKDFIM